MKQKNYQERGKVYTSLMPQKWLVCLLTLLVTFVGSGRMWADDVTLFSTDFSTSDWTDKTFNQGNTTTPDVINGITFYSRSDSKQFSIADGKLNFPSNNMNANNYFMAIPVTNVKGKLTITVTNGTEKTQFRYDCISGTDVETSGINTSNATGAASPSVATINNLTVNGSYVIYIGQQSSNYPTIQTITITTSDDDSGQGGGEPAELEAITTNKVWNFADGSWSSTTYTGGITKIVDNLQIKVKSGSNMATDGKVFKLAASGTTSDHYLKLKLGEGAYRVTAYGKSASSSGTGRKLVIYASDTEKNTDTEVSTTEFTEVSQVVTVTSGTKDVFIYSSSSGINLSRIEVHPVYRLNYTCYDSKGTVAVHYGAIDEFTSTSITSGEYLQAGTVITFVTTPSANVVDNGISGVTPKVTGKEGGKTAYVVSMPASDTDVTLGFIDGVTINVASNNESMGTVKLYSASDADQNNLSGVLISKNEQVIVLAEPKPGYKFVEWEKGDVTQSDKASFSQKADNIAGTLTAIFESSTAKTNIGAEDNSTGWWSDFSDFYAIKANEEITFTFKNYGGEQSYHNWVLIATNEEAHYDHGQSASYREYLAMTPNTNIWTGGSLTLYDRERNAITTTADVPETFAQEIENGVDVTVKVSFSGTNLYIYSKIGENWVLTGSQDANSSGQPVYLSFSVENSHITDFSASAPVAASALTIAGATNGSVSVKTSEGIVLPTGTYIGANTVLDVVATPNDGYALSTYTANKTTDNTDVVGTVINGSNLFMPDYALTVGATFAQSIEFDGDDEIVVNLLDLKMTSGMPTIDGATYSSANDKIVRVDPYTGALTFLNTGVTSIIATKNGQTASYKITVMADDAKETITENGTQYNVTASGKLGSNIVTSIPYITLQYGAVGEVAIVREVNDGYGVNVIGAAEGNIGSLVPNSGTNPTSGTYYVFTPQLSGQLTVSGYFTKTGSHSAWMWEYDSSQHKLGTHITNGTWERNTNEIVTQTVSVEAGKSYYLMAVLDEDHENVFWLNSFKFVSNLKFDANSEIVENKASKGASFTMTAKAVQGTQYGDVTAYSVKVVKDAGSNLSASVSGSTITINSATNSDGGAVIVTATVTSTSGVKNNLSYVITVPYIGNHTWDLANMANKSENKTDGHWYLTYEVRNPGNIKDPIVVMQDKVLGDNAKYIDESNGLYITTNGTSNIGLAVTGSTIDYSSETTMKAATIADVTEVNLMAVTNATVKIPQLKKDWFVKVYLDPHTGNSHGSGSGSEFTVNNLCDLTGKAIDPSHVIMSYGTQWTTSTTYDNKSPRAPYAGCLIFRVQEAGDVSFNFRNNGWNKIVKIEVSDTYSTEMVLGSIGSRTVDLLRWNHSWVHREKADGTDAGVNINYNGDPLVRAENAKPIDHSVYNYLDPVFGTHRESNWTSKGGVTYTQVNYDAAKGVGNLKVISDANYNGWTYNADTKTWTDTNVKYVLNRNESWIVVGKLKEQVYPYTWDFETYNMNKPLEAVRSTKLMEATVDTTYGHWGNSKQTNFLAKVKASASYNFVDNTSSVDNTWNSAGECKTDFAPAVETVKLREKYETNVNSTGTMLEQTVSGLANGLYTVTLCANANYTDGRGFDSDLIDGSMDVAYVFANDVQVPIKAKIGGSVAQNGEYTMNVQVTDGTLHLGLAKRIPGTNWHTIQIKSLIYNEVIDDAGQGTSPFYTINDAGKKTYNIEINKPLFANGAQLTHGFEPIRETEGLGISIDNAYFTASNRVDSRQEQVVLDGTKLQVNNTNWHVLIPSVDAGMYVFVKGAEPTATTNLENSDVVFAATTDGDVHYWKVTATGDVNLTFASGASVKKIGVTNQVKSINKYGYATESRMLAIDHNETKKFSADVDAYFVGEYSKETSKVNTTQVAVGQHIPAYTGLLLMGTEAKNGTEGSSSYNVPLFVPAVNISRDADVESEYAIGNKMKPNTTGRNNANANPAFDTPVVVNKIPTTETDDDEVEYMNYTLSNVYIKVNPTTNEIVNDKEQGKTLQTIAFYKYVGDQQGKTPQANLAYLHLEKEGLSAVSLAKSVVLLGYDWFEDEEETTRIEQVNHDDADEAYYTVSGVRLKSKPTTSGLYIKNGKKIYVK